MRQIMRETQLFCDSHDVDVQYTNEAVFERSHYGVHPLIRDDVFRWLASQGRQGVDWGVLDRLPDDGFEGETFQFTTLARAVMFKLTWGGS
jgi:hypothetical protein